MTSTSGKHPGPAQSLPAIASLLPASRRWRALIYQVLLALAIVLAGAYLYINVTKNLRAQHIATGFDFIGQTAQFSIGETLINFSARDSYGRALLVGLLNTLYCSAVGIVIATLLGLGIGIARTSQNWLLQQVAGVYVDVLRNIPVILQVIFWAVVIRNLPSPRQAIELGTVGFLTNRGLTLTVPAADAGWQAAGLALALAIVVALLLRAGLRQFAIRSGRYLHATPFLLLLVAAPSLLAWLLNGMPHRLDVPVRQGFNFSGGLTITPEFTALVMGIALYSSAFIAEIVRAGIQSVPHGQLEAANSLSLKPWHVTRYVVLPQALRVIIPPLTSQYVSLMKNSSIAVVVGYPELVNIGNTVMNQTGQAMEVIALLMVVYLIISVSASLLMNIFNRLAAIKER